MNRTEKLPKIADPRGNLSFIQSGPGGACPFEPECVKWWYDLSSHDSAVIHPGHSREAMFVPLSGSFDCGDATFRNPSTALIADSAPDTKLHSFASNTVVLMLCAGEHPSPLPADTPDPHPASSVEACRIISLPRLSQNGAGSCSWVDNADSPLPFSVRRVFYLYDVPADATRGGHSHFQAQELIVAMAGSFDVVVDDGKNAPRRFTLNRPYLGLYIPTGIWRTLENFSGGAVSTVLTSHPYSEPDYVREYSQFKALSNPA
ncbi:MAG: FdtA/QdtA family cupin domain-containing protein [Muribaculaceae bacterium]|nr:FdtA/QdtA family cupin domain-containing protein [Muribaculaceae bacterium]